MLEDKIGRQEEKLRLCEQNVEGMVFKGYGNNLILSFRNTLIL